MTGNEPIFGRRVPRRQGPKRHRYGNAQPSHVVKRRLLAAGMTAWQLADLLGVHEHQIDLEELPYLPVRVLLELARHLDIHPADLIAGADDLFERPRQPEVLDRRPPGTARHRPRRPHPDHRARPRRWTPHRRRDRARPVPRAVSWAWTIALASVSMSAASSRPHRPVRSAGLVGRRSDGGVVRRGRIPAL
ncbi:hypothetical protein [Streptomyces goshikiensis]|uniref:hypothetical protein n=1 Tax=Streptomyces goshikiensis TaxID=1942 RepID=UPI00368A22C2